MFLNGLRNKVFPLVTYIYINNHINGYIGCMYMYLLIVSYAKDKDTQSLYFPVLHLYQPLSLFSQLVWR